MSHPYLLIKVKSFRERGAASRRLTDGCESACKFDSICRLGSAGVFHMFDDRSRPWRPIRSLDMG